MTVAPGSRQSIDGNFGGVSNELRPSTEEWLTFAKDSIADSRLAMKSGSQNRFLDTLEHVTVPSNERFARL